MTTELPVGTRYLQIKHGAVAVTPDEHVYLCANGRAVRLVVPDDLYEPPVAGVAITTDEE